MLLDWLSGLIAPLNDVLFTVGSDAATWAELLGFVTGAVSVWLTVRNHVANFPVGIANSAFFLVLFATARLWADSSLQVVYVVVGLLGWWQWLHGGPLRRALAVTAASRPHLVRVLVITAASTVGLTFLLHAADDSAPFWDALTTSISLGAQWLLNARKVASWWFWIAADVIYVPLYLARHLDLTAIVYVLFLGLSVVGLRQWRHLRRLAAAAPGHATIDSGAR